MSIFNDITELISVAPAVEGYPASGQKLPYVVSRPLTLDSGDPAISGDSVVADHQYTLYCCAGSVEASFNLAVAVCRELQGARVGGTTLNTSVGYIGAPVEGHYESQVTVQLNQGGI